MTLATFVDLFAGIGGFHQALKELNLHCVAACEIDKHARTTYLANHAVPENKFFTDIHKTDIPDHDILCAGFPCQPFSIAGKKAGLTDSRANVVSSMFKIIETKRPKFVILENVKHIAHIQNGEIFKYIIDILESFGYKVSYKLCNAKDFGVPQNRERWIFVGTLLSDKFEFTYKKSKPISLGDVIQNDGDFTYLNSEDFVLLKHPTQQPSGLIFSGYRNKRLRREGNPRQSRNHRQCYRIYSIEGIHPTLSSQLGDRYLISLPNGKVRKMTLNECFAIMGYNESFVKPVSKKSII